MVPSIASSLVATLALAASVDGEVGVRAESRTTTLAPANVSSDTRTGWLAAGRAELWLDGADLRLRGTWAPRFFTSDVEGRPSPIAAHELTARLETRHGAAWSADGEVSAARGRTDPLADPWQAMEAARGNLEATSLDPIPFEALRGGGGATVPFHLRTTLAGRAGAWRSGGSDAAARVELPVQRGVALDVSLTHLASRRDTLRIEAAAMGTTTAVFRLEPGAAPTPAGDARTGWATLSATWRRRLTAALDGWAGAGAALSVEDMPLAATRRSRFPVGEVGLGHELPRTSLEVAARIVPYVDRRTSEVGPMGLAACEAWIRWSPRLSITATASAGSTPDRDTTIATGEVMARLELPRQLGLELGLVARRQRERRPELPSFTLGALVAGVTWDSRRRLEERPARETPEERPAPPR